MAGMRGNEESTALGRAASEVAEFCADRFKGAGADFSIAFTGRWHRGPGEEDILDDYIPAERATNLLFGIGELALSGGAGLAYLVISGIDKVTSLGE